jgi:hypothetical protein
VVGRRGGRSCGDAKRPPSPLATFVRRRRCRHPSSPLTFLTWVPHTGSRWFEAPVRDVVHVRFATAVHAERLRTCVKELGHEPGVNIRDEPTPGTDVNSRAEPREERTFGTSVPLETSVAARDLRLRSHLSSARESNRTATFGESSPATVNCQRRQPTAQGATTRTESSGTSLSPYICRTRPARVEEIVPRSEFATRAKRLEPAPRGRRRRTAATTAAR